MPDKEKPITGSEALKIIEKALEQAMPIRVHGQVSDHEEAQGNPVLLGGRYIDGDPVYANSQVGYLRINKNGKLEVCLGREQVNVTGSVQVSNISNDTEGRTKVVVESSALPRNGATQEDQKKTHKILESLDAKIKKIDSEELLQISSISNLLLNSISEKLKVVDTGNVTLSESDAHIGTVSLGKENKVVLDGTSAVRIESGVVNEVKSVGSLIGALPSGGNLIGNIGIDGKMNHVVVDNELGVKVHGTVPVTLSSLPEGNNLLGRVVIEGAVSVARDGVPTNIPTNTTVTIKVGAGSLCSVIINSAGKESKAVLYDNTSGGSGTKLATIDTTVPREMHFNCLFYTGLTIVTSGTLPADITITHV